MSVVKMLLVFAALVYVSSSQSPPLTSPQNRPSPGATAAARKIRFFGLNPAAFKLYRMLERVSNFDYLTVDFVNLTVCYLQPRQQLDDQESQAEEEAYFERQYDDYGHMRFGKRNLKFDDYGHMRFGK